MLKKGFITLNRKILRWEWYQNANTMRVFLHLLLTANYEDCKFEGVVIKRGSRVASTKTLAQELRISNQSVRTAIEHLKSTNVITSTSTSKYTVFSVLNYDYYQTNQQTEQQTINKQATNEQQTSNNNETKLTKKNKANKAIIREKAHHKHGEFGHVLLTDEQYESLVKDLGETKVAEYIRKVDEYCEQYGKSYKNYSLTIRKWINKDQSGKKKSKSYDLEEWEKYALHFNPNERKPND